MTTPTPTPTRRDLPLGPSALWAGLGAATFAAAMVLAYRPDLSAGDGIAVAVLPWVLLGLGTITVSRLPMPVRATALVGVLVIWAVLLLDDDTWSVLSFAVYLLCFTFDTRRQLVGIVLSGLATVTWIGAWSVSDNPLWVVLLPGIVFVAAATLSVAMHRTGRMAEEQAALAAELRATRDELAASERTRGVLEERARMAGEIHDTLAQGFTSIVLLTRGAQRATGPGRHAGHDRGRRRDLPHRGTPHRAMQRSHWSWRASRCTTHWPRTCTRRLHRRRPGRSTSPAARPR